MSRNPERIIPLSPRDAPVVDVTVGIDGDPSSREIRRIYRHLGHLPSGIEERLFRILGVMSAHQGFRTVEVWKNPACTWEETEPRILSVLSGRRRKAPPYRPRITVRATRSFPAQHQYFIQPILVPFRFTPNLGAEIRVDDGLSLSKEDPHIRRTLERRLGALVPGLQKLPGFLGASLGPHFLDVSMEDRAWRRVRKNFPARLRRKGPLPRWHDVDAAVLQLLAPFYGMPLADLAIHRERAY